MEESDGQRTIEGIRGNSETREEGKETEQGAIDTRATNGDEARIDEEKKTKGKYSIACVVQCECGAINISDNDRLIFAAMHNCVIEIMCQKCGKRVISTFKNKSKEGPRILVPGVNQKAFRGLHV